MLFTTIINLIFVANFATLQTSPKEVSTQNFKNLQPLTYKDIIFEKNNLTYEKVPTKLIKINKNSI